MRAVKGRSTKPELLVRRLLHAMGYRYRVNLRIASAQPDIVFTRRKRALFVHGCFWHAHDCPRGARAPKANADFWAAKLRANRERDARQLRALADAGWRAMVVWECELADRDAQAARLRAFLGPRAAG